MYILAVLALTLAGLIEVAPDEILKALFFFCNIGKESCSWFVGHTWSLAYEEQYYLFFPFLFIACISAGNRHIVMLVMGAVMLSSLLMHAASYHQAAEYMSTFGYMLMGCIFAFYWQQLQILLKQMPLAVWATLLIVTPTMVSLIILPSPLHYFITVVLAPPAICAVVLGTPVSVPLIGRFFLNPVIAYLGKVSFTIYLWQQLATAPYEGTQLYFVYLALAGVLVLSLISYQYFELPLIRLGSKYSKKSKSKDLSIVR